MKRLLCTMLLGTALWSAPSHADTTVCVDVKLHEVAPPPSKERSLVPPLTPAPAATVMPHSPALPFGPPTSGLKPPPPRPEPSAEEPADTEEQRQLRYMQQQIRDAQNQTPAPAATAAAPAIEVDTTGTLPLGQSPIHYLKRLLEHFVTHERGYQAVPANCQQHLQLELYPLNQGWTAFARYSGTGREERVDYLFADELSQFAERAVLALLYGHPISTTIKRDTVLRADSKRAMQRIRGTNHFIMNLGTELRGGYLPTVNSGDSGSVSDQVRLFSPMTLGLGYRGKFESWGVETTVGVGIGTSKTGLAENSLGGHVDYGGNLSLSLHFLRYLNPRGLTSWYLGAGGSFEMLWLWAIRPQDQRQETDRDSLISGGLDVDLLVGVEFMRASRAQFFLQGGLVLPAYVVDNEENGTQAHSWMPGVALKLGMMF